MLELLRSTEKLLKTIQKMCAVVDNSCTKEKNVTMVKFDNHLGTAVWPLLKQFMLQKNPKAAGEIHFMCNYCKNLI